MVAAKAAPKAAKRKPRGRPFPKGRSGNPKGKPKGTRHQATQIAEALMAGDIEAIVDRVVRKAKRGDLAASKLVLDRVAPVRKGSTVEIALPDVKTSSDIVAAMAALMAAVVGGKISPEEAQSMAAVLEINRKAIEQHELEARIARLEQRATEL